MTKPCCLCTTMAHGVASAAPAAVSIYSAGPGNCASVAMIVAIDASSNSARTCLRSLCRGHHRIYSPAGQWPCRVTNSLCRSAPTSGAPVIEGVGPRTGKPSLCSSRAPTHLRSQLRSPQIRNIAELGGLTRPNGVVSLSRHRSMAWLWRSHCLQVKRCAYHSTLV